MRRSIGMQRQRAARMLVVAVALALSTAGCASKPSSWPSIVGLWSVQQITGKPVPPDARMTLSLYGDGRAVGRAGCNNYTGTYTRESATAISFDKIAATKMACAPELMDVEQAYLAALGAMTRVYRQPNNTLVMSTGHTAEIL